jgi:hypothetical protein
MSAYDWRTRVTSCATRRLGQGLVQEAKPAGAGAVFGRFHEIGKSLARWRPAIENPVQVFRYRFT